MDIVGDVYRPSRVSMSVQPTLHLLSYEVKIVSVSKTELPQVTHSLLNITLKLLDEDSSYRNESFYCFTETNSEYSLLLDKKLFKELENSSTSLGNVSMAEGTWRPIVIEVGAFGSLSGISKIAASVIGPLADEGVPVFCLSSNQEDYVMVKETDLESALMCLHTRFKLICDSDLPADTKLVESIVDLNCPLSTTVPTLLLPRHPADLPKNPRPIVHPFICSPVKFHICSVLPSALPSITQPLLQKMFFSKASEKNNPFFSFSIIGDNISLVVDSTDIIKFPSDCVYSTDSHWRIFTIGSGPLGFDECGIVAQICNPLADEEISTFYICTYCNDHILIPESTGVTKALKILNKLTISSGSTNSNSEVPSVF